MKEFNEQLFNLGLQKVIERYLKSYFDFHGDILPAKGLYNCIIKEIEKPLIEESLRRLGGNQVQVARLLGMNRNTLRRKMKTLNINIEKLDNVA